MAVLLLTLRLLDGAVCLCVVLLMIILAQGLLPRHSYFAVICRGGLLPCSCGSSKFMDELTCLTSRNTQFFRGYLSTSAPRHHASFWLHQHPLHGPRHSPGETELARVDILQHAAGVLQPGFSHLLLFIVVIPNC